MAFQKINNLTVDTKFSELIADNYFFDSVMIEGLTYTSKYKTGPAGQIMVHKLTPASVSVTAPGGKFTHGSTENELIEINLDNELKYSKEIFDVQSATVAIPLVAAEVELGANEMRDTKQTHFVGHLVKNGTALDVATITAANVDEEILKARKKIKDAKGKASAILVSTEVYNIMLADRTKFTPISNESLRTRGVVGTLYGLPVIECNNLQGEVTLRGDSSATSLENVNFIMLDHRCFSVIDVLATARTKDAIDFVGIYVQGQINCGFKVTNSDMVLVSKKA